MAIKEQLLLIGKNYFGKHCKKLKRFGTFVGIIELIYKLYLEQMKPYEYSESQIPYKQYLKAVEKTKFRIKVLLDRNNSYSGKLF